MEKDYSGSIIIDNKDRYTYKPTQSEAGISQSFGAGEAVIKNHIEKKGINPKELIRHIVFGHSELNFDNLIHDILEYKQKMNSDEYKLLIKAVGNFILHKYTNFERLNSPGYIQELISLFFVCYIEGFSIDLFNKKFSKNISELIANSNVDLDVALDLFLAGSYATASLTKTSSVLNSRLTNIRARDIDKPIVEKIVMGYITDNLITDITEIKKEFLLFYSVNNTR
jgi:hypothetical protein